MRNTAKGSHEAGRPCSNFSRVGVSMQETGSPEIREFYSRFPYPSIAFHGKYNIAKHANKVLKASGLSVANLGGKRALDIGCGTGEIACSLAFNGAKVVGVDFCSASLERARRLAERYSLKSISFIEADLFQLPLKKSSGFDVVCLLGVAHHTSAPRLAFKIACSLLKHNGVILFGAYNKTARQRHRKVQRELARKAGNDTEKKLEIAVEKFYGRNANKLAQIFLADKYCNPLERSISLREALSWLKEEKIELLGCEPRIIFEKTLENNEKRWLEEERSFFILAGKKK